VNLTNILSIVINIEPCVWLITLSAIYFCGERRTARLQRSSLKNVRDDELPPDYRSLGVYIVCKLLSLLAYFIFIVQVIPLGMSTYTAHAVNQTLYWILYFVSTVCIFVFMAVIIKGSLRPLPGLSSAALIVFRWASLLALAIALTAHLPVFGLSSGILWLNEASISFLLCVCTFEVTLLVMLLTQLRRLGLCLRSRPIGFALGIALLGCMDLLSAVTLNLSTHIVAWVDLLNEGVIFFTLTLWTYYIVAPEPKRLAHSLSPASGLMKWNEIALKLGMSGKQAEQAPFISGVESTVDAILEKFKSRAG
jgi:hypothetical protein